MLSAESASESNADISPSRSNIVSRMNISIVITFVVCFILYAVFGTFAFMQFGDDTESDVLRVRKQNLGHNHLYIALVNILLIAIVRRM
jgi:amino acid permease